MIRRTVKNSDFQLQGTTPKFVSMHILVFENRVGPGAYW